MELSDALEPAKTDVPSSTTPAPASSAPSPAVKDTPPTEAPEYRPTTLRAVLDKGRMPTEQVANLGLSLCEALSNLHRAGLVHRAVRTSNVIFRSGRPTLADVGLTTATTGRAGTQVSRTSEPLRTEATGSTAADISALGLVLYEALTGLNHYEYPRLPGDLIVTRQVRRIDQIIRRASSPEGDLRYRTAVELHDDLLQAQSESSLNLQDRREKQLTWIGGTLAALFTAGLIVAMLAPSFSSNRPDAAQQAASNKNQLDAEAMAAHGWAAIEKITPAGIMAAQQFFKAALELSPNCNTAHQGLSRAQAFGADLCLPPDIAWPSVVLHAQFMEKVAKEDWRPLYWMSMEKFLYRRDIPEAEREIRLALKLYPDYSLGHAQLGRILRFDGRLAEGHAEIRRAEQLAISASETNSLLEIGSIFWEERDYLKAAKYFHALGKADPSLAYHLGTAYKEMGRFQDGLDIFKGQKEEDLAETEKAVLHAELLHLTGHAAEALDIAHQLEQRSQTTNYVSAYLRAKLEIRLGHDEKGWKLLNEAVDQKSRRLVLLGPEAFWDPYRKDPRFVAVVKRLQLAPQSEKIALSGIASIH
jgi:hypothetical protein